MELEDIKSLKWRTEIDIANLMSNFERKTGLKISSIDTERNEVLIYGDRNPVTYSRSVELNIKL